MRLSSWLIYLSLFLTAGAVHAQQNATTNPQDVPSGGVYYWYDDAGSLHVTDQIDDVPSNYRRDALQRAKEGAALPAGNVSVFEGQGPVAPAEPVIRQDGEADQSTDGGDKVEDIRTRDYWQNLIASQEQAKADAQAELATLEAEILRVKAIRPPGFHESLINLDQDIQKQKAIIAAAEQQLNSGIKERARVLDIPPGWLR